MKSVTTFSLENFLLGELSVRILSHKDYQKFINYLKQCNVKVTFAEQESFNRHMISYPHEVMSVVMNTYNEVTSHNNLQSVIVQTNGVRERQVYVWNNTLTVNKFSARVGDIVRISRRTPQKDYTMTAIVCKGYSHGFRCVPLGAEYLGPDYTEKPWSRYKSFIINSEQGYFIRYDNPELSFEHIHEGVHEYFYQDTVCHTIQYCLNPKSRGCQEFENTSFHTYRIVSYKNPENHLYYAYAFIDDSYGAGARSAELSTAKSQALIRARICKLEFKLKNCNKEEN